MKDNQKKKGSDTDKALAKPGTGKTRGKDSKSPETDFPLSEKDEVKQAEERQRKRAKEGS